MPRLTGETEVDFAELNERYDRLWSKAERLVEAFLDQQLAALEGNPTQPMPTDLDAKKADTVRSRRRGARSAGLTRRAPKACKETSDASPPILVPKPAPAAPGTSVMREIFIAVQCLKRIHEGRYAAHGGGGNSDVQSLGSPDATKTVAEEISRRIRELCKPNHSDGNDEDSV